MGEQPQKDTVCVSKNNNRNNELIKWLIKEIL